MGLPRAALCKREFTELWHFLHTCSLPKTTLPHNNPKIAVIDRVTDGPQHSETRRS